MEWYFGLGILIGLIPFGITLRTPFGKWTTDGQQILASTLSYLVFVIFWPYFVLCWILIWLEK